MADFDLSSLFADPELVAALSEYGIFPEEMGLFDQQTRRADALRNTAMPEMRQAGGTQVAANPLEFAASALGRIKGEHQLAGVQGQQTDALNRIRATAQALAKKLRERPTAPFAAPPGPPPYTPDDPMGLYGGR